MPVLTVNQVSNTGLSMITDGVAADVGGDQFANNGNTYISVENGDVSPTTLTFTSTVLIDGDLTVADRDVIVAAGDFVTIGPFQKSIYDDGNDDVQVAYSSITSLNVVVFQRGS